MRWKNLKVLLIIKYHITFRKKEFKRWEINISVKYNSKSLRKSISIDILLILYLDEWKCENIKCEIWE